MNLNETLTARRYRVVEAGTVLRAAQDALTQARAFAEQRAIDAAGGSKALGANEDERKRALLIALSKDPLYRDAQQKLSQAEAAKEQAEAELESACDQRRQWEWSIRARLADALLAGMGLTDPDDAAMTDATLDAAADRTVTRFRGEPRRSTPPTRPAVTPHPATRPMPQQLDDDTLDGLVPPKVLMSMRRNVPQPVSDNDIPF